MKIYVAGPYTPSKSDLHDAARIAHKNTLRAIRAGIAIIERGHIPFIPHLTHFIHLETRKPLPRDFYIQYDSIWLRYCDAMLYLGKSSGADRELKMAKDKGLRIFYSVSDIPLNRKKHHGKEISATTMRDSAQRHEKDAGQKVT